MTNRSASAPSRGTSARTQVAQRQRVPSSAQDARRNPIAVAAAALPRRQVVAVAAGVLLAAGAAELVLRLTHWGVYDAVEPDYQFIESADRSYWVFDPAYRQRQQWDGDPYGCLPPGAQMTYELNSLGLRGAEPQAGRPKVLLVGDSFTFGVGMPVADTFAARIERDLAARFDPAPQIIDGGMPGYGAVEEAGRLHAWLPDLAPRTVVVVYQPNDPIPLSECGPNADLIRPAQRQPALYLARLFDGVLRRPAADRAVEDWYASYYFGERRARWSMARDALASMKQASAAAGAKFGVAIFPLLHDLGGAPFAQIHETVADACRRMRIPVLDLAPALAREPERALWLHPADHHPNARAHQLAAEAMTPFVESLLR